jgi:SAM-dependent methyltransferase
VNPVNRPSPWVERFAYLVAPGARVLDVAAGHGRHARFFASRGARVVAIDRDGDALATLRDVMGVQTHVADLESGPWPLPGEAFDAVIVSNYLHRPLFAHLLSAVRHDGVLLYETFSEGNARFGRPSNPDFLLRQGELLDVVGTTMTVIAFEQGVIEDERTAVVQRVAAVGRARAWPTPLRDRNRNTPEAG